MSVMIAWNMFDKELTDLEKDFSRVYENAFYAIGQVGVDSARNTTLFKHGNDFESGIQFIGKFPEGILVSETKPEALAEWLEYGNLVEGTVLPFNTPHVVFIEAIKDFRYVKNTVAHGPLPYMEQAGNAMADAADGVFTTEFNKVIL